MPFVPETTGGELVPNISTRSTAFAVSQDIFPGAVINVQEGDVGKTLKEGLNVSGLNVREFAFLKSILLRLKFLPAL
jgi:hypothetical protein